jgi:hypothetical protein
MAGIIELDSDPTQPLAVADDSTLERLFAGFAGRDSISPDPVEPSPRSASPRWTRVGEDLVYDSRPTLSADLGALVRELEQEYELVCEALRHSHPSGH